MSNDIIEERTGPLNGKAANGDNPLKLRVSPLGFNGSAWSPSHQLCKDLSHLRLRQFER